MWVSLKADSSPVKPPDENTFHSHIDCSLWDPQKTVQLSHAEILDPQKLRNMCCLKTLRLWEFARICAEIDKWYTSSVIVFFPFLQTGGYDLWRVRTFPKVMYIIRGTARIQAQDCLIPEPLLLITTPGCLLPFRVASSSYHQALQGPSSISYLPSSSFSS